MISKEQLSKFKFVDIAAFEGVELTIREDGLVLWVNVDDICIARIVTNGFVPITIEDKRK